MSVMRSSSRECGGCAAATVGFCASLSRDTIRRISANARHARFRKSEVVTIRSDMPLTALVLKSGTIKVSYTLRDGRQQIVDFLSVGDVLIRHPGDGAFAKSIEAMTDVDACQIGFAGLSELCAVSPDLSETLLAATISEVDRKNNQLTMLGHKRSEERVASFLVDLILRAERRGEQLPQLKLPMSRSEIADYLGLTTETVSRAFSFLREERIIRLPKPNEVVICDRAALVEMAAGGASVLVR